LVVFTLRSITVYVVQSLALYARAQRGQLGRADIRSIHTTLRDDPSGETHRPRTKSGSNVRDGHSGLQLQQLYELWHFQSADFSRASVRAACWAAPRMIPEVEVSESQDSDRLAGALGDLSDSEK
jgi:hypothetical protein